MRWLRAFLVRLGGCLRRTHREQELNDELNSHLQLHIDDNMRAGMSPDEARRQALLKLGSVEAVKEEMRDRQRLPWLEHLAQDVRYAARSLRKSPGFTFVAVLSLALGIGANTAVFSLVNAVLLQMLPVKNPEQLVLFQWTTEENVEPPYLSFWRTPGPGSNQYTSTGFSPATLEAFRANAPTLSDVFGFQPSKFHVNAEDSTESVSGQFVSGDYHRGIGVGAIAGRLITTDDDKPGAEPVVVISHRYWQRRFAGDPRAIGKVVVINDWPMTIIGVTEPGFNGSAQVDWVIDITLPLAQMPRFVAPENLYQIPISWSVHIMGRMKPAATLEQTRASL